MSNTSYFSEIWDILWADTSTLDPKTALKAEAFRKVFVAAFKKEPKTKGLPPGIDQKKVENVRARAWDAFQKKLNPYDKIIILIVNPLERRVSMGSGKTDDSIVSPTNEEGKLYSKENDSSLMLYRDDESWKVTFRTLLPKLAGKSVLLVITDEQGEAVVRETKELEENKDDEVWEFEYPLPKHMKLTQSHTLEIGYLGEDK